MKFFWLITLLATLLAGLNIPFTLVTSQSAPQQAAGFAMSCAIAIVPYVFCRALEALSESEASKAAARIIQAMKPQSTPNQTEAES